jgi:predicted amidohydrolase
MAGRVTRIALFQSRTCIDPAANADALVKAIAHAADGGAEMLFTPEMSGLLDRDASRARHNVRTEEDDPVLAACREACKARGIWLHLGSLAVLAEGDKFANRGFVIDSDGEIRATYDKIHLFDVDLPTGETWRESNIYRGGSDAVVVSGTPVGKLGLTICYDLRFPQLFQRLTDAGAEVVAVPAAFTVPTGRAHWEILLRARAIEAGVFIVAAAQCGRHEDGRETYGHSLVVDPWGTIAADLRDSVGVGLAEIDVSRVADIRRRIPAIDHRRPVGEAVSR